MKRRLLTPDDANRYRWLLNLDSPFDVPALPRGFDYEAQIDQTLEMIWSPRMTDMLGIDLNRFNRITNVNITRQKRDLLDVALTFGPIPASRSFLAATDLLLQAENTGNHPIDLRPPALRALPARLEAIDGIEVWCGAATAVRCDIALVLADLDLTHRRLRCMSECSIRAHSIAGPRLRTDCRLLKGFFETDFHAGSVALTRGYFSGARYLVHAVPPRSDHGVWKHSLDQLNSCYEGFWEFARQLKPTRIALQLIPVGTEARFQEIARNTLMDHVLRFLDSHPKPPTISLVADTTADGIALATAVRRYRCEARLRESGGLRPAGSPGGNLAPGTFDTRNASALTDRTLANRSSISTVGFSSPRSRRLT